LISPVPVVRKKVKKKRKKKRIFRGKQTTRRKRAKLCAPSKKTVRRKENGKLNPRKLRRAKRGKLDFGIARGRGGTLKPQSAGDQSLSAKRF